MRLGDLDHLRNRVTNGECNGDALDLVDTEPTVIIDDENNKIRWIPSQRERRTKDCHSISHGVECSRCRKFQTYETRFCGDCGGYFDGELPIKNNYSERKMKGTKIWHG